MSKGRKDYKVLIMPLNKEGEWHSLGDINMSRMPNTFETIRAFYDSSVGSYAIGLSDEDLKRLSEIIKVDLSPSFDNDFWATELKLKIGNEGLVLDPNNALDEIKIAVAKANKYIANSLKEWKNGLWPDAKFVIKNEREEAEVEEGIINLKLEAAKIFDKLTPVKRKQLLKLYGKGANNVTDSFVTAKLYGEMENNPKDFIKKATMDAKELDVRSLIFDLENMGIIINKGGQLTYNDDVLGYDREDTVANLLKPKAQELLVSLKEKLEAKQINR